MKAFRQIRPTGWPWSRLDALDESRAREAMACYAFVGWVNPPGGGELLKQLCTSFAAARLFADTVDLRRAQARIRRSGPQWTLAQTRRDGCFLLVAPSSLATCSVVADTLAQGWSLVIEDTPFSRSFLAPAGSSRRNGVELQPGHRLPARQREIRQLSASGGVLFVSFCDRPARGSGDDIGTEVVGGRYLFSPLDALLLAADFDGVFLLGRELQPVPVASARVDWSAGYIRGETLFHYTELCGRALTEVILSAPGHYLGMSQLVTRNTRYRAMVTAGRISEVKSLLHYCQLAGPTLPEHSYIRLLLELDAAGAAGVSASHPVGS